MARQPRTMGFTRVYKTGGRSLYDLFFSTLSSFTQSCTKRTVTKGVFRTKLFRRSQLALSHPGRLHGYRPSTRSALDLLPELATRSYADAACHPSTLTTLPTTLHHSAPSTQIEAPRSMDDHRCDCTYHERRYACGHRDGLSAKHQCRKNLHELMRIYDPREGVLPFRWSTSCKPDRRRNVRVKRMRRLCDGCAGETRQGWRFVRVMGGHWH